MKVAYLSNKKNVLIRKIGKELLSYSYLLFSKQKINMKELILPEYDYFAKLLDTDALKIGALEEIDYRKLKGYDLLIWEWGWTPEGAKNIINIKKNIDIPVLLFPGPLGRFWREVDNKDIRVHMEACEVVDFVGVMLKDTIEFYSEFFPHAHVFHMPVPVDTELFKKYAVDPETKDKSSILLTAPTIFSGNSSQIPITTYLAFRNMLTTIDDLNGMCFVYSQEEFKEAESVFMDIGLKDSIEIVKFMRPIFKFFDKIKNCYSGVTLPHALIQGRHALVCACLGIPLVVSEEIETHRFLYPQTNTKWNRPTKAGNLGLRLIKDKVFYNEVRKYAWDTVEFYNIENCKKRMLNALGKIEIN